MRRNARARNAPADASGLGSRRQNYNADLGTDGIAAAATIARIVMSLIGLFVLVQIVGFGIDAAWHGLLNPGFEATSAAEMAVHLATVHVPLYVGVVGLFVAVAVTLARDVRRGTASPALWVALGGATMQLTGEAWHVWTHLHLAPEPVVPATLGLLGFIVALTALGIEWRHRRRAATTGRARRAA